MLCANHCMTEVLLHFDNSIKIKVKKRRSHINDYKELLMSQRDRSLLSRTKSF